MLKGRATDLVLELMLPDPRCKKEVKAVAKRQKPVTEPQAESNQDEFTTLARQRFELEDRSLTCSARAAPNSTKSSKPATTTSR